MSKSTSFSPTQVISIKSSSLISEHRFVNFSGSITANSAQVLGVSYLEHKSNEIIPVITLGTAIIETSEAIAVGDKVSATTSGTAKVSAVNDKVNGRAITACSGAGFITILLTP